MSVIPIRWSIFPGNDIANDHITQKPAAGRPEWQTAILDRVCRRSCFKDPLCLYFSIARVASLSQAASSSVR